MAEKRIEDLFVVGKPVKIEQGEDYAEAWIAKLLPFQAEKAMKAANAKRSAVLATRRDPLSQEFREYTAELMEKSEEDLVIELSAQEIREREELIEAELASEEEWSKDKYLEGLREAWGEISDEDSLSRHYLDDPEDIEANKVFQEFERFSNEVTARLEVDKEIILNKWRNKTLEQLQDEWIKKVLDNEGTKAWLTEYRKQEVFYATRRSDDHRKYYWPTVNDLDWIEPEAYFRILNEYLSLTVDLQAGKVLEEVPYSSEPSESPEKMETEASSGPQAVSQ